LQTEHTHDSRMNCSTFWDPAFERTAILSELFLGAQPVTNQGVPKKSS
jgi:hypothetical protein